jgi:hypothetical protein
MSSIFASNLTANIKNITVNATEISRPIYFVSDPTVSGTIFILSAVSIFSLLSVVLFEFTRRVKILKHVFYSRQQICR